MPKNIEAIRDEQIAELDRRWAAVKGGQATVPQANVEQWLQTWGAPEFRRWLES
jgi:hypothetical protein